MTVGDFIKNKRLEKGLTVRGLAIKSGVSGGYISQVETNVLDAPPSDEKIIKLADALNMSEWEKKELLKLAALERTPDIIRKEFEKLKSLCICEDTLEYKTHSNAEIITSDLLRVPVFSHVCGI